MNNYKPDPYIHIAQRAFKRYFKSSDGVTELKIIITKLEKFAISSTA